MVTGGLGFIGSHLVDRLLEDGWDVLAIDSLATGKLSNLAHQRRNNRLRIATVDIRSKSVRRLISGTDTVFHLAAHADIRKSLRDHTFDLEHNLVGTLNVLEAMLASKVKELVFASSSAAYGEASVRPTPEEYMPIQTSLYGASKLACESFAQAYGELFPMKLWSFRFANVVGERCRRGVVWDFVHKLKRNPGELEILGDGKQSKEYLYIGDCVEGIMTGYGKSSTTVNNFNLGTDEQTIVDQVAGIVIREMKLSDVRRKYTGGERGWIGDNPVVQLKLDKIKSLGWTQSVSAEEAIARTTRWTVQSLRGK